MAGAKPEILVIWFSRWNLLYITTESLYITISGLTADILNLRLPVTLGNIRNGTFEFMRSETLDRTVEITFLSHLGAEIQVHPVWRPPY